MLQGIESVTTSTENESISLGVAEKTTKKVVY